MKNNDLEISDLDTIHDILNGDKEKFGLIIKKYQGYVFSIINRLLGNTEDTKDVLQEVFIKIYYSLPKYNIRYDFKNWIYKITLNYALDIIRKRNSRKNLEKNFNSFDLTQSEYLFYEEDDRKNIEFKEKMQKILSIIYYKLKPKYKEVVILRYMEGLTIEEISEILKISCQNVKIRLHRGIKMIKNSLKFL
ncbi:MAG: RNA polymerase sigma factor [Endomicrobiia bacterium]